MRALEVGEQRSAADAGLLSGATGGYRRRNSSDGCTVGRKSEQENRGS